jgi:transcriptional regulator with XRE-family HTH domain
MTGDPKTAVEKYASFPRGAQELSAARLANRVLSCLHRAKEASGNSARQIAELLGLSEGAVSQVLNGDGNIRISTLGRYVRAMGYEIELSLSPASKSARPAELESRRRRPSARDTSLPGTPRELSFSISRCSATDGDVVAQALSLVVVPHFDESGRSASRGLTVRPSDRQWHILNSPLAALPERPHWRSASGSGATSEMGSKPRGAVTAAQNEQDMTR